MLSEEAQIGRRVRVREDHQAPDWRGKAGTIAKRWGDPSYTALDVLLDDGGRQLFWHHELEEVDTMVETHSGQDVSTRRGRNDHCPPHGPHLVTALGESHYVVRCLRCGLVGPERKDGQDAKLAFDQRWH